MAFSSSEQDYECIKEQAISRLNNIVSLYEKKVDLLKQKADSNDFCDYTGILDQLAELKKASEQEFDLNAAKELEDRNKQLKKSNCPELYLQ